jgi:hypothetical protein
MGLACERRLLLAQLRYENLNTVIIGSAGGINGNKAFSVSMRVRVARVVGRIGTGTEGQSRSWPHARLQRRSQPVRLRIELGDMPIPYARKKPRYGATRAIKETM